MLQNQVVSASPSKHTVYIQLSPTAFYAQKGKEKAALQASFLGVFPHINKPLLEVEEKWDATCLIV